MAVLDRSELEASPLADLHAIADQLGLDGFRRLRKADLIDAILGESEATPARPRTTPARPTATPPRQGATDEAEEGDRPRSRRRRAPRLRRGRAAESDAEAEEAGEDPEQDDAPRRREEEPEERPARGARPRARRARVPRREPSRRGEDEDDGRSAEGVVEVLGNGSAFLRVDPPEPSDDDVYISAAQVRRCELVSGDRVTGPVRTPRRSERYPSLVRIDTINGAGPTPSPTARATTTCRSPGPSERLALGAEDPTLEAIEWLTPLGQGSRVTIAGPRGAGKSETLRRLHAALKGTEGLEVSVVLAGARPEEIADWAGASRRARTPRRWPPR